MKSLQGHLLVASPRLSDGNFFRTVVLMVQHTEDGALGLVLNRPLDTTIQAVWTQVSEVPCDIEDQLHQGGPCDGPLMLVHTSEEHSQIQVVPGVYFSTDRDSIQRLVSLNDCPMKFFVGYAGWAPGQLEGELEEGSWLLTPATQQQIFEGSEELWDSVMREIGRSSLSWLNPKVIPEDPSMN